MPGANLSLLEGPRKSYSETTTGKIGTPISKATWKAPFSKDHVLHVQPKLLNKSPALQIYSLYFLQFLVVSEFR